MKDLQEKYIKRLENGYLEIYKIFATHAYNDVSMLDKIYKIVKEMKEII